LGLVTCNYAYFTGINIISTCNCNLRIQFYQYILFGLIWIWTLTTPSVFWSSFWIWSECSLWKN